MTKLDRRSQRLNVLTLLIKRELDLCRLNFQLQICATLCELLLSLLQLLPSLDWCRSQ